MEKQLFNQLIESAKEARDISKRRAKPSRVFRYKEKDIIKIRQNLRLSQSQFAQLLKIPTGTLRNWEQGRTVPDAPAQTLLLIADKEPSILPKIALSTMTVYKTSPPSKLRSAKKRASH